MRGDIPFDLLLVAVGLAAGGATLLGGWLALRMTGRIHLILGFSAGAVIGVALLDLLPEALALEGAARVPLLLAAGFIAYMLADRTLLILASGRQHHRGHFGAASLVAHSLLDGLGIGLGFQASTAVGVALAAAVLAHDLADGVNTVNVSLANTQNAGSARRWLFADAAAPLLGILVSRCVTLPETILGQAVAVFGGFFLYIGASELIPESHHRHPRAWTTASTVAGVAVIWLVVRLAGV